jgi:hypothetical protein
MSRDDRDGRIGWLLGELTASSTRVLIHPHEAGVWRVKVRRYRLEREVTGSSLLEVMERALDAVIDRGALPIRRVPRG